MKKKITYTDEPLGDIQVVEDFLPPPEQFIFKEDESKVTDDKCVERELAKRRSRKVKAMRPGEVTSDKQAFSQILRRLEDDVGTILQLVSKGKKVGHFPATAPFWALLRMMFPIAEAVGDLIYRNTSTVQNLQSILENEFEAVRPGYQGKAAILTLLFWHSLTHTDELRRLVIGQREVGWSVSWSEQTSHLSLLNVPGIDVIRFDTTAFYEDLVAVCHSAMGKPWNNQVMKRYNGWLTFDLDQKGKTRIIKSAIAELTNLQRSV